MKTQALTTTNSFRTIYRCAIALLIATIAIMMFLTSEKSNAETDKPYGAEPCVSNYNNIKKYVVWIPNDGVSYGSIWFDLVGNDTFSTPTNITISISNKSTVNSTVTNRCETKTFDQKNSIMLPLGGMLPAYSAYYKFDSTFKFSQGTYTIDISSDGPIPPIHNIGIAANGVEPSVRTLIPIFENLVMCKMGSTEEQCTWDGQPNPVPPTTPITIDRCNDDPIADCAPPSIPRTTPTTTTPTTIDRCNDDPNADCAPPSVPRTTPLPTTPGTGTTPGTNTTSTKVTGTTPGTNTTSTKVTVSLPPVPVDATTSSTVVVQPTATPTTQTGITVLGTTVQNTTSVSPSSGSSLPFTGSSTRTMLIWALSIMLTGLLMLGVHKQYLFRSNI